MKRKQSSYVFLFFWWILIDVEPRSIPVPPDNHLSEAGPGTGIFIRISGAEMRFLNEKQLERMKNGKGFIAALDQSGGSTPKALERYGVGKDATVPMLKCSISCMKCGRASLPVLSFSSEYILAAILFENTMDRQIQGMPTSDYLWEKKGVVPLLKVDKVDWTRKRRRTAHEADAGPG